MTAPSPRPRPWHRRMLRWMQHEMPRPRLRMRFERTRARRRMQRRILLVGENALMWQYLDDYRALFAGDPRLRFFASPAHKGTKAEPCRALAAERGLPCVTRYAGAESWWDLVVFANHGAAHRFPRPVPKLRIQHALSAGKRISGRLFRYDPGLVLRADGRSLYDMLFEASLELREQTERTLPALQGRVRVVGDLRADALLALDADRLRIRAELGYSAEDQVVVLCSTWGTGSLVEQMGRALLEEAEALSARSHYRFLVSVHPQAWREPAVADWLDSAGSEGVRVLGPGVDWERAFVAADVLVADHTSLVAMFALLCKPIVSVPVPAEVLDPDSPLGRLHALAPTLDSPAALEDALGQAAAALPATTMESIAHAIDAYPGTAAARMRAATYELLSLDAPDDPIGDPRTDGIWSGPVPDREDTPRS